VGLSSLARMLGAFAQVDINAGLGDRRAQALSLDAAFWRVAGGSRAHLYAHEMAAARSRLERFMARWRPVEPDAVGSVGDRFMAKVEYLRHPERAMRPRTIAIFERHDQEAKRRFRPGRSFVAGRNMQAMVRLLALPHNCLIDRIDWVAYAARWRWQQPIAPPTTHQQERPQSMSRFQCEVTRLSRSAAFRPPSPAQIAWRR